MVLHTYKTSSPFPSSSFFSSLTPISFLKILLEGGLPLLAPLSSTHGLCGPWWHTQTRHRHYSACPSVLPLCLWAAAARPDPLWILAFQGGQLLQLISTRPMMLLGGTAVRVKLQRCSCPLSGKSCFVILCSDAETHSWGF